MRNMSQRIVILSGVMVFLSFLVACKPPEFPHEYEIADARMVLCEETVTEHVCDLQQVDSFFSENEVCIAWTDVKRGSDDLLSIAIYKDNKRIDVYTEPQPRQPELAQVCRVTPAGQFEESGKYETEFILTEGLETDLEWYVIPSDDNIRLRDTYTVGVLSSPMFYGEWELASFEQELIEELAMIVGFEISYVEMVDWQYAFAELENGKYDIIVSATSIAPSPTYEKQQQANFTVPYFQAPQMLIAPSNSNLDFSTSLTIGVSSVDMARTLIEGWPANETNSTLELYNNPYIAIELLNQGYLDAVVVDGLVAHRILAENLNLSLSAITINGQEETYRIAVRKNLSFLLRELNEALKSFLESSTYEELCRKWNVVYGCVGDILPLIPTPSVGEPVISLSSPVPPDTRIGISVAVDGVAGSEITYEWSHPEGQGQIVAGQGTNDIIYQVPSEAGIYYVDVKVSSGDSIIERSAFVTVEEPTDTPMPTDTPTPSVTDTLTPTSTPELPSHEKPCDDFTSTVVIRPPLDASEFIGYITAPQHCQTQLPPGTRIQVDGNAVDIPEDEDVFLWVLVYTRNARYYPQCDDASAGLCGANLARSRWAVTTYIGQEGCKEGVHLVLIATDSVGNDFFIDTMKTWVADNRFPGFTVGELPEGITELDAIEVETAGTVEGCP